MVRLGHVSPEVWDKVVDFMEFKFADLDFREEDIYIDWQIDAKLQRTSRELYEIYGTEFSSLHICELNAIATLRSFHVIGPFKDYFLHPSILWIAEVMNKLFATEIFMGETVLPVPTAVIVLFLVRESLLSTPPSSMLSLFNHLFLLL